jgi:hypothetical protein
LTTANSQQRERRVSAPSAKIIENRKFADASMEPPSRKPLRKENILVPAAMIEKMYKTIVELNTAVLELTEQSKKQSAKLNSLAEELSEEKKCRKEEAAAIVGELGVFKKAFIDSQSRIPTWAQMVASGSPAASATTPVSTAQVLSTSSSGSMSSRPRDLHTITVMMDRLHEQVAQEVDFKDTLRLRQRLEQSVKGCTATKDTLICGFHVNINTETVRFDVSLNDAKTVRSSQAWIDSHFGGARLLQPDWFPVKVDRVPKHFANQQGTERLREEIATIFGKENGVDAVKMRYLGTVQPAKAHGSVVIFVSNKNDQGKLLEADEVRLGGFTVFAKEYKRLPKPYRCKKCQLLGHKERTCDNEITCGHCAQKGHSSCESPWPKCVNCNGPYPSAHHDCRVFGAAKDKLRARSS